MLHCGVAGRRPGRGTSERGKWNHVEMKQEISSTEKEVTEEKDGKAAQNCKGRGVK